MESVPNADPEESSEGLEQINLFASVPLVRTCSHPSWVGRWVVDRLLSWLFGKFVGCWLVGELVCLLVAWLCCQQTANQFYYSSRFPANQHVLHILLYIS